MNIFVKLKRQNFVEWAEMSTSKQDEKFLVDF